MTIEGNVFISPHAVRRYIERIRPGLSFEAARAELIRDLAAAHPVRRELNGCVLFRGPKPRRMRYIVGPGEGSMPALVTVLSPHDGWVAR